MTEYPYNGVSLMKWESIHVMRSLLIKREVKVTTQKLSDDFWVSNCYLLRRSDDHSLRLLVILAHQFRCCAVMVMLISRVRV